MSKKLISVTVKNINEKELDTPVTTLLDPKRIISMTEVDPGGADDALVVYHNPDSNRNVEYTTDEDPATIAADANSAGDVILTPVDVKKVDDHVYSTPQTRHINTGLIKSVVEDKDDATDSKIEYYTLNSVTHEELIVDEPVATILAEANA